MFGDNVSVLVDDGDHFTYTGLVLYIYIYGISVVTNHGLERDFFEPSFVRANPTLPATESGCGIAR